MVAHHATDAPSVYLSAWARTTSATPADVDRALYTDRTLVRQLAMRRTLFAFPRELIPAVLPSSAARVATTERTRMARDLVRAGIADDETSGSPVPRQKCWRLSTATPHCPQHS